MARRRLILGAWLLIASFSGAAHAQQPDPMMEQEARNLFEAGRVAFEAGRFDAALRYFQDAYELSRRPGLLFNIAASHDRLQRNAPALEAYRAYRAAVPDAPNRALVDRRIEFLEQALAERAQSREVPPEDDAPPPEAPPSPSGGGTNAAPWVVLAASGAVVVAGAVLLGVGRADAASVEGAPQGSAWGDVASAAERAPILSMVGGVALGVGVAGVAGALLWGLLDTGGGETSVSVGPGFVQVQGRF